MDENLFPDGAKIKEMVNSTFTNLTYLSLESENGMLLVEIDIMQQSHTLNKTGETFAKIVISDRHGTLYIESKLDDQPKILALWDITKDYGDPEFHRQTVVEDSTNSILLGDREGKLYIGELENGQLVGIKQADEGDDHQALAFSTLWEGHIPYSDQSKVLIGDRGQVVIYDDHTAYVVENKKEKAITLSGDESVISSDGLQLAEFTHQDKATDVELKPLDSEKSSK